MRTLLLGFIIFASVSAFSSTEFKRRLTPMFGFHGLKSSGILFGGQLGFTVWKKAAFSIGPEVNFTLFSPGALMNTLAGGWFDFVLARTPHLGMTLGLLYGAGFSMGNSSLPDVSTATYLDVALYQNLDELVSIRGHFRPGWVASQFAFMVCFAVSFRF